MQDTTTTPHEFAVSHPRWDDQVALEMEMREEGKTRMQDRINKARSKHNMASLRPHRNLMHEWVRPVSEALQEFLARFAVGAAPRRGRPDMRPIAVDCLTQLNPDSAAFTALKAVLRMLGLEQRGLLAIAREIGTNCEHEARMEFWEQQEGDDWRRVQENFKRRGSTAIHQRRSTIAIFNRYKHDLLGWSDWTEEERFRVGLEMINLVITATKRFYVAEDPNWVPKRIKGGAWAQRPKVLAADHELLVWLEGALDDELFHRPAFMPTLMPPLEWEGPRGGGYYTPYVKGPALLRFKAQNEEQSQMALNDFESYDMPQVYEAVNYMQRTPWAINKQVLSVLETIWTADLGIAGIIRQEHEQVEARPEGAEKGSDAYREWARGASEVLAKNEQKVSAYLTQRRTLLLARRMEDEPEFFFPHHLDFRGRMYPIVSDLSPQGRDLERGLLTFARGKPVDELDSQWLAIHLANTWGQDKVSYGERMQWVNERRDRWLAIAGDPLGNREWLEADGGDSAWQALAATIEWARYLEEGPGMISALPIRVDGTCNGIQHLSAMVRDEQGGRSVNLVPGNQPRDIYAEVADLVTIALKARMKDHHAAMWLAAVGGNVPRSLTKQPVMILPYGGTMNAYFGSTMEWVKKHDPDCNSIPKTERNAAVKYLTGILMECVKGVVVKALEVMDWIQRCCKVTTDVSAPLVWKTPAGFIVRHFYGKAEEYRIKTRIDGQELFLRASRQTKVLDTASQTRGVAPNFVHSMDASALMTSTLHAKDRGIECLTTIHDAYGTVAGDMWALTECLRAAFIETYETPVLGDFLEACKYLAGNDKEWPELPAFGDLDLEEIRNSDYFFA